MKTKLFRKIVETHGRASLLALLLLLATAPAFAQTNGITISNFKAAPGIDNAPTTLTFNIKWTPPTDDPDKVWSDTVWVFVDYNNAGTMTRLPLATGATLTDPSWDSAQVIEVADNHNGVWVVGNARAITGSFSATVQLLAGRDVARHVSTGMCIYAINYPPVGRYAAADKIQFNGTPDFILTLTDNSTVTVLRAAAGTYAIPEGKALKSFTDASKAPGKCIPMRGDIDFTIPNYVVKGLATTFTAVHPQAPASFAITYHWSAPSFNSSSGTGATFTATAPTTANTYAVTLTATAAGHCDKTVTKEVDVIDCILPATYTLTASQASICDGSAVTLTLSGSEGSAWSYQLYDGASSVGTAVSGNNGEIKFSTTPAVGGHTYTVHTVNGNPTRCNVLASSSVAVTVNPLPTITLLSGSPEQTIGWGSAITPIKYTTANATNASISDQPDGVTAEWNAHTYTVSGTPTVDGTFNYTVTASHTNACPDAKQGGRLIVNRVFASSATYSLGGYTWSDRVISSPPECTLSDAPCVDNASHYYDREGKRYYNIQCIRQIVNKVCPSPWILPDCKTCSASLANTLKSHPNHGGYNTCDSMPYGFVGACVGGYFYWQDHMGGGGVRDYDNWTNNTATILCILP